MTSEPKPNETADHHPGPHGGPSGGVADTRPTDRAEVLIVGAGAAGAAAAWRLAAAGIDVLCLEQGGPMPPEDGPLTAADWEARRLGPWHPNPNVRRAPADDPVDDAECPIRPLTVNAVGGSTVMWSAHQPRFHPSDFRMRALDGVGADWPLRYEELAPYYALNERIGGLSGRAGNPAYPAGARSAPARPRRRRPSAGRSGGSRPPSTGSAGHGGRRTWPSTPGPTGNRGPASTAARANWAASTGRRRAPTSPTGPERWRPERGWSAARG